MLGNELPALTILLNDVFEVDKGRLPNADIAVTIITDNKEVNRKVVSRFHLRECVVAFVSRVGVETAS